MLPTYKYHLSLGLIILVVGGLILMNGTHTTELDAWVKNLSNSNGSLRIEASKFLLAGRIESKEALLRSHPGPTQVTKPLRAAILLAIIESKIPDCASLQSFGLSVEPLTLRSEIESAGQEFGFSLKPASGFNPMTHPACYVELAPGRDLMKVLREVLTHIPWVTTVNFQIVEP
jgi:hypothetical protein